MALVFVADTITKGDLVTLFRIGRVLFLDPSHVTTPWGETRSIGAYEEGGGVVDIPGVDHVLRSELLSGYASGSVRETTEKALAKCLSAALYKPLEDATSALACGDHFRFQPVHCHAMIEFIPMWVVIRREEKVTSVAVVSDSVQRVGTRNINALVWKTGDVEWSLGNVTPNN